MKFRYAMISLGSAIIISLMAFFPQSNVEYQEKESVLMQAVLSYLNRLHFDPVDLDDEMSRESFNQYIDRIDGNKWYLLQEEVDEMKKKNTTLDDEAKQGTFNFFDESVVIIEGAIERAERIYGEMIDYDFDFDLDEEMELDAEKISYAGNLDELKDRWRKHIKYRMLDRIERRMSRQEAEEFDGEVLTESEIIEKARAQVKKSLDRMFDRVKRRRRVDWLSTYVNSIVNIYDPHSGYYKPKDKEDFDMQMSGTLEGIGAQLTQDKDYVKVVRIVPGGPAYKQGELGVDDLIIKVAQQDEEPIDVVGWHIDDVVSKIRGKKGTKVTLTVKKKDGTVAEIMITRDVIVFEDNYVNSFIIEHEEYPDKVGYIKLPSFYTSAFGQKDGRSSGEDVRKELQKLKRDEVDGVILDLRNNGGGSLRDVVEMSGLFIEDGPVVQVKSRGRKPYVLDDEDPSVVYDGPVIVLVNNFSASASEILPAALQDYERALIVGSNATYGKGSVQRFYPLDRAVKGRPELKPLGEIKLTTQKFYRINGGATQLKGVRPDIVLPDPYSKLDYGERTYDHAMPWSEIDEVEYEQDIYKVSNIEELVKRSEKRVAQNEIFSKVEEYADLLNERKEESVSPLNLDAYLAKVKKLEEENDAFDDMYEKIEELQVSNLTADIDYIQSDSTRIAKNDDLMKRIKKDIQLEESVAILHDMIHMKVN